MIFLTILWGTSIVSKAAVTTNVSGLTWANDHETKNIPITMRVPVTDCEKSYSTYYYDTFYEGDFYFNFYANGNVTPYLSTNLNYEFCVSPSTALNRISIKSASYTYSLIVAGAEYTLSEKSGWLNLISANVINSYITLKVHFAGIIRLEASYSNYQKPLIEFNSTLGMNGALVTWNCYENTDTVHENYKMLQQLVNGNEGIKGAIEEGNKLQEQGNQLQEEENRLQEEANETSKNIFQKISDFFAGFFEGIINAFKSLFIPEDGYFSEYFGRLNDFFADKLGMLYAPIDMFISVLNGFLNASASDAGIPFPGIKWGDTYFIEPQTVSLTEILSNFPELQEKIYFVTNIVMIGAVLLLLQNKLKGVLNR